MYSLVTICCKNQTQFIRVQLYIGRPTIKLYVWQIYTFSLMAKWKSKQITKLKAAGQGYDLTT